MIHDMYRWSGSWLSTKIELSRPMKADSQHPQQIQLQHEANFKWNGHFRGLKKDIIVCILLNQIIPQIDTKVRCMNHVHFQSLPWSEYICSKPSKSLEGIMNCVRMLFSGISHHWPAHHAPFLSYLIIRGKNYQFHGRIMGILWHSLAKPKHIGKSCIWIINKLRYYTSKSNVLNLIMKMVSFSCVIKTVYQTTFI